MSDKIYATVSSTAKIVIPSKAGIQRNAGFPRVKHGASLAKPGMTKRLGLALSSIKNDSSAITLDLHRLLLPLTIWSCHVWVAPTFKLYHDLTAAAFGVRGVNKPSTPRSLEPLNPSGFTLIELILVVVIIGILAATVLPRINFGSTSSRASVDGAANMIASDIRYAQEFAMANRLSKSIVFTNGSSTYTFNPVSSGMDPSGQLPSVRGVSAVTIGTTVTFTFNSLGEPTAGGGSSVTVSAGGLTRTITVTQYTGKVSIS